MGGGGWDSDDPARGAARLALLLVVLLGVVVADGMALVVVDVVEDPRTEAGIEAAATFAIRLMATTCERDCILCC